MIAIVIIVIVLLGLLGTLGAAAQGVVTGRQRTIATSLARQEIENLQGAKYSDVKTGTGVSADPLVTGTKFDPATLNEDIFPGGTASYRTDILATGTLFSLRTFVTLVPTTGYRRATVIVEWPKASPKHSLRFSSFVFPLVNASYPASNGSAEVTGGLVTVSGCLGGDTFDDVHVGLPSVRADTSAATLRSAISGAGNATSHVEVHGRPDPSSCTPEGATGSDNCVRETVDAITDNDSTTPTIIKIANPPGETFAACVAGPTAGGVSVVTPAGMGANSISSHSKTDACAPTSLCTGFAGTADAVPFADTKVITSAGSYATFNSGGLAGNLWTFGANWSPTASVDHVETGTGSVKASATLIAPTLNVFALPGLAAGAVKVSGFTATASAASGDTTVAPVVNFPVAPVVQLSDGTATGYIPVVWAPGSALDFTAPERTMTIGGRNVSFISRVESQASTATVTAGTPRPSAHADHPSLLRVTVVVTISPSTIVAPTTTTSTTTSTTTAPEATTTTVAPIPLATDTFVIVVEYGRVSANGAWLAKAA